MPGEDGPITAAEYLVVRTKAHAAVRAAYRRIKTAAKRVVIPPPGDLRRATAADIVVGTVIYYRVTTPDAAYWKVVEEVNYPDDDFKAYVAEDGCRYGLHEAWVDASPPPGEGET